jgi:hypothetical protein
MPEPFCLSTFLCQAFEKANEIGTLFMQERRHVARHKSLLRGFVYFGGSPSAIDCTVRDMSEIGARLKFSGAPVSSEHLTLDIPAKGQTFQATTIWQRANEIGISFNNIARAEGENKTEVDICTRVERLEKEIVTLRTLIKEIQARSGATADVA